MTEVQPPVAPLPLAAVYVHLQSLAAYGCSVSRERELSNDRRTEQLVIRVEGKDSQGQSFRHCALAPWPCLVNEDICAPLRKLRQAVEQNCYPAPRLPR